MVYWTYLPHTKWICKIHDNGVLVAILQILTYARKIYYDWDPEFAQFCCRTDTAEFE